MISVAALAGFCIVGGFILTWSGLQLRPVDPDQPGLAWRPRTPPERFVAIGVGAVLGLLVTRWPAMAVVGGTIGGLIPLTGRRLTMASRAEAIALWAEMLRDSVGSARGVESVLVGTASAAPAAIREHVQQAAARLPYEPFDDVMESLANDLAHPIGDLVVSAMRLAARSGGRHLREVLNNLAAAAHAESDALRRIEVARQQPRSTMRTVIVIVGAFCGLLFVGARDWVSAYSTPVGQVVLLFVAAWFAAGIYWMSYMGRPPRVERFFVRRPQL